jgi:hypothetical protein
MGAQAAPVWMGAHGEEKKRVKADGPETAAQAAPGWMWIRSTKGTAHELDCERELDCGPCGTNQSEARELLKEA